MARPEKVAVVDEIKEKLESSRAVFITEYRGLTVGQQQELRRSLREADAEYKVVKMSLARRAAEAAGLTDLLGWLEGPTAIAFTDADPVPAAKSLKQFSDTNDLLVLKGGLLAGDTLDSDALRRLAEIEPREVLLANLAGAMAGPMSKFAGLMSAILRQPASAIQQLLEKREAESPEAPVGVKADEPAAEEVADADAAVETTAEDGEAVDEHKAEATVAAEASEEPASAETADEESTEPAAEAEVEEEPAAAVADDDGGAAADDDSKDSE